MIVSDYSMWLPMMFMMFPGMYQRSKGAVLKRFLVDFMNPDTPPERIASMMKALETRPGILNIWGKFYSVGLTVDYIVVSCRTMRF